MQNLITYSRSIANQAYQYSQKNPYKAVACSLFVLGTAVATGLTIKKSAELGLSFINDCMSYKDYNPTCDWIGYTQPEQPVFPLDLNHLPFMTFMS